MRIAMVGPFGFHPKKTMRARAFPLARALVRRGHELHLFMPPWHTPEKANTAWVEEGVDVRYVSLQGGVLGTTRNLIRETLAYDPDVVHCFKPKAYSGLTAWWLWYFHRRLRLVVDSDDWEGRGGWNELEPYSPLQKRFFAWQERWGMRHCRALTVASRALQTLAWAQGVDPQRVVYLPNGPGVDGNAEGARAQREKLGLSERPVLLLYSRLFEFNTGRLVTVLHRVHEAVPDLAVLAVGAGLFDEDVAELGRQLEAAGLREAIVDVGWIPESELPSTLAAADVGLYLIDDTLLNRTKCPVKLADMLAVGLPVVAEAVGQVPEYVRDGESGYLCASGDAAGIADAAIQLLQDKTSRADLGQGARRRLQTHFSWARLAERLEEAYGA